MPIVTDPHPRTSGSTHYIVCDVQGRQGLVPQSQPFNEDLVFFVRQDPGSGQEFYVNAKTREKTWDLPDPDAAAATEMTTTPPLKEGDGNSEPRAPVETLESLGTVYKLVQSEGGAQYIPQDLPFEPSLLHCWHPLYEAEGNRFVYNNCETGERVERLPPICDYCDAIRQMYKHYNIEGSYMDALRLHSGKEKWLLEQLSIQHGPRPLRGEELRELALCYFTKYDTSMLDNLDSLIKEWRGGEIGFLEALQKEYGGRPRTTRERVRAMYAQYHPSKMLQCDEEVEKYKGQDDLLIETLQESLGPELIKGDEPLELIEQRILCQFLNYDSERASSLDVVLSKHRGFELQLLELLVCHYGPEVAAEKMQQLLMAHQLTLAGGACGDVGADSQWNDGDNPTDAAVEAPDVAVTVKTEMEPVGDTRDHNCEELQRSGSEKNALENTPLVPNLTVDEHSPSTSLITQTCTALREESVANENLLAIEPLPLSSTIKPLDTDAADAANGAAEKPPLSTFMFQDTDSSSLFSVLNPDHKPITQRWMLEMERKVREQESYRQQQQIILEEEERLVRDVDAHQRLVALEIEKRWKEETEKVMEIARTAAYNAAQEVAALQQLRCGQIDGNEISKDAADNKECPNSIETMGPDKVSLVAQLAQIEAQLRDAFAQVTEYSQRNEKLQSANLRLTRNFAEMRHQYDLELQGMRIHLDDMRLRIVTIKNEHEVKILHLKNQEEATVSTIARKLERERSHTAEAKAARAEMEETIAQLQEKLRMSLAEQDALGSRLASLGTTLEERTKELEEISIFMERRRTAWQDAAVQTEDSAVGANSHVSVISNNASCGLASSSIKCPRCAAGVSAERVCLEEAYEESQRRVEKLSATRSGLMVEREELLCVIGGLRRKVEVLEATVAKLELRQLAIPDVPLCVGKQDNVILNLRDELKKSGSRLVEAQAESTLLKREVRDLRSLLAIYMSNARRS